MKAYRILGTTEEHTTCWNCGREDLTKTVVMGVLDADGNVVAAEYMGTTCASHAAKMDQKDVTKEARAADTAKAEAEARQRRADNRTKEDVIAERIEEILGMPFSTAVSTLGPAAIWKARGEAKRQLAA